MPYKPLPGAESGANAPPDAPRRRTRPARSTTTSSSSPAAAAADPHRPGGVARGYSWPPFAPGHEVNLRHGARTARYVEPLAAALAAALLADRPDLEAYPEAVAAWAVAEARCDRYRAWHGEVDFLDAEGNVRGGANVAVYERQAQALRERLGLDPLADATLQRTRAEAVSVAVDLDAIRARGREAYAARRAAEAPAGPADALAPVGSVT